MSGRVRYGAGVQRRKVESSVLATVGYDADTRVLEVALVGGRVYRYDDVPEILYRRLLAARSLGAFYNAEIRDAYAYTEITPARRP